MIVPYVPTGMKNSTRLALLLLLSLTACSSSKPKPAYRSETFDQQSPYEHHFDASAKRTCEAARRGLLSQGYVITETQPTALKAEKSFQPEAEDHIVLQFNVMCVPGTSGSSTYASVVQSHYQLKKSATAASVGVSALGSISLPWSGMSDSMVRVGGETISDAKFYTRFFDLVERMIPDTPESDKPSAASAPAITMPVVSHPIIEREERGSTGNTPASKGEPDNPPSGVVTDSTTTAVPDADLTPTPTTSTATPAATTAQ